MKLLVLVLLVLGTAYRLALNIVQYRSAGNPIPANVADVYDGETYEKWRRYCGEKSRLEIVSTVFSFVTMVALLCTDAYAAFVRLLPGETWQLFAAVLLDSTMSALVAVGINYYENMVIEEKYGFNRTRGKTFVADQIRRFVAETGIGVFLAWLVYVLHMTLGNWMILLFAGVVFCFTLAISFLFPLFSRLGNKFTPLEEGELRDSLQALLTKHGYKVKAIEVMDASRRTTKLNAYFAGFGKMKKIVLFDNLVNAMTPEEICAVFAHELGHGLHKDVLKRQVMNVGNLLLMAVVAWLTVLEPGLYTAFGFEGVNYGFAFVLMGIGLGLVQPLSSMAMNAYSRRAEYRADRQAVEEGYGDAMVTGLKKLAKENFAHLAPSPVNVVLEYSHPPLSQRIAAIEQAQKK